MKKRKEWLQSDRDKQIWTDRDMAFAAAVALCVGWVFGYIAFLP